MILCLKDAKQQRSSWEFTKTYKKSETADCLWKLENKHNTMSNQFIIIFTTNNQ